jgi:hypothetical protein
MSVETTPERRAEMVRMALAEAGWPEVPVVVDETGAVSVDGDCPDAVAWTAGALAFTFAGFRFPCFACYVGTGERDDLIALATCAHDTWDGAPDLRALA